jgi:hypothetical protein
MNTLITHLRNHINDSHDWANKLINGLSEDKWFQTPNVIDTNIAWQIGHLTLSQYYYTIVLLHGPDKTLSEQIDMKKYSDLFAKGDKRKELLNQVTAHELEEKWNWMQDHTMDAIADLQDKDLNDETFRTHRPHPFVRTIENAISWNIKHTMWHCGQMAILKRIVDERYDFGF